MQAVTTEKGGACSVCHRRLRDPESIRAGIGPVCRAKTRPHGQEEVQANQRVPPPFLPESPQVDDLPKARSMTYVGFRRDGEARVLIGWHDGAAYSLDHVMYHSPTGFEWGYGGSGAADLARSILAHAAGLKVADAFYMRFKFDVVAKLPREGFRLPESAIIAWLRDQMVHAKEA